MNNRTFVSRTIQAAALAVFGLAFAASPGLAAAPRITIGTEGVYPPFTFLDEKGELTGYDVEVVKAVGQRAGLQIQFVPTPWDSLFLALDSRKFDGVANEISKNADREKKYAFSDPYLVSAAQIIVRGDRSGSFSHGLADLKGAKVGTGVGSNYSKLLEDFNNRNGHGLALKYYDGNLTTVLQDLVAGRLDATLNDRLTVGYTVQKLGLNVKTVGAPLQQVPSFFVFRKDAQGEALARQFNQGLAELRQDGSLARLSQKWFGGDYSK